MLAGGVLAAFNPFLATLTAEQIAGWLFLFSGVFQLAAVFGSGRTSRRIWVVVLALAFLWLGFSLLANPLAGIVALTIVVASGFLAAGAIKTMIAFSLRGTAAFWPILVSGLLSLALAGLVFFNIAQAAVVLLGIILALELVSSGVSLVFFALHLREMEAR